VLRGLIATVVALSATSGGLAPGHGSIRHVSLGRSALGSRIDADHLGSGSPVVLVVGCIHGTECAGIDVVRRLVRAHPPVTLWLVPNQNPDGLRLRRRQNGRGVDLNRNFPSGWIAGGRRWDAEYPGPRPASERETRIAMRLILRIWPRVTIWFHQPLGFVRAWGGSIPTARRYARLAGVPFQRLPWYAGTAPNWQNHRFPGSASFVVELPPGRLSPSAAARYARAVLRLGQ
jgi:protein MpaA